MSDLNLENWGAERKPSLYSHANTGFFASKKVNDEIIEYESPLERDFFLLLDHDPSVKLFQPQYPKIAYKDKEGKNYTYTLDAAVRFTNGLTIIVAIKKEVPEGEAYLKKRKNGMLPMFTLENMG